MLKKIFACLFLAALIISPAHAVEISPYYIYPYYVDNGNNNDEVQAIYNRYGNLDIGFLYQLRDITGSSRSEQVGGPQWFATVFENYYYYFHHRTNETIRTMYRRTLGGETSDVPISVVGDVIDGFNFVLAEEPQPYESWINRGIISTNLYDVYPDPIESMCFVITNGTGNINVRFANPYARHFPFWWGWGVDTTANTSWWQYYDWRQYAPVTADPIQYIVSGNTIYERGIDNRYTEKYLRISSGDITDTNGATVYRLSGDVSGFHQYYDTNGELFCSVSNDRIFDKNNNFVWTIESNTLERYIPTNTSNTTRTTELYICAVRRIAESVEFSGEGFEDYYTFTPNPAPDQQVYSGNYFTSNFRIRGASNYDYGSRLGYITFRQRASFATGYSNYREFTSIPLVIANVSDGNASDNPLLFDMLVFDNTGKIINRVKFNWDAQNSLPNLDFGKFFMMTPYNSSMPTYYLETRITNRTGTRYELFRYDQYGRNSSPDVEYRGDYMGIRPAHWKYDLTQDLYGTLPDTFMLDAHSQIAPGLVTVYRSNVYGTINMNYDTSESFRLYEYSSPYPKDLRLNYTRIAGMTTAGDPQPLSAGDTSVTTQGFQMQFADVTRDENETDYELRNLMGNSPLMVAATDSAVTPEQVYINSSAMNAFTINKSVPASLQTLAVYSQDLNTGEIFTRAGIPLQPVSVRLRIPRQNRLLQSHWEDLDGAESAAEVFRRFSDFGTIWVRSSSTREYDANLLTAINNKGSNIGVGAADCIRAFTYNDELYLDFMVLLADAKSQKEGMTAFVEVFKDDNVPYILIGDGLVDTNWQMTFYVAAAGETPDLRPEPVQSQDNTSTNNNNSSVGSGGGGGGCNFGLAGILSLAICVMPFRKK